MTEVVAENEQAYHFYFYDERAPELAERLLAEISRVRSLIEEHPQMYQRVGAKYRRAPLDIFPLVIVYREFQTESIMLALAHHSRKPNYWCRRAHN